jgi:hypothetical protein
MRFVAMGVALIVSLGQLLPFAMLALLGPPCTYLARHRLLRPIAWLLFPGIVVAFVMLYAFRLVAMPLGCYLYCKSALGGEVEEGGIRLTGRKLPRRTWLPWAEMRSIRWEPTPPLGAHYRVGLRDGSEVRIHSLPFDSPLDACEQIQRRLTEGKSIG